MCMKTTHCGCTGGCVPDYFLVGSIDFLGAFSSTWGLQTASSQELHRHLNHNMSFLHVAFVQIKQMKLEWTEPDKLLSSVTTLRAKLS